MISDSASVSLFDGTQVAAMEVYVGKDILSFGHSHQMKRARVVEKTVEAKTDVIGLVLSSGQRFSGTRDQKVCVMRKKIARFVPLADVMIGDRVRGERAGMPVSYEVIGLTFDPRPVRLVGLKTHGGSNFVAAGILCR